jgi:hypothetical protein
MLAKEREHHRQILGALGLVHRKRIDVEELIQLIRIVADLVAVEGDGDAVVIWGCARDERERAARGQVHVLTHDKICYCPSRASFESALSEHSLSPIRYQRKPRNR